MKSGSNRHYPGRPITETLTNGFFTVDKKWTVKYWNNAAEKLMGVPAAEIIGKNFWEEFAGIIPLEFYTVYQKAFVKNIPVHFEEYWGEMGAWFDVITYYCEDTLSVSFKSSNHPHAEYPANPEKRLKTLTELYRFVTEITNDCLWEWDLNSEEIFWIDGGHKRTFGYQVENALIPQSFWESCLHPDDKERVLSSLAKTINAKSSVIWQEEYRFKTADGTYANVHDKGHVIYEAGKASRMIGATEDVTERVMLENKIIQQRLERQREITSTVLTALELERKEIGKELHDDINQVLAITKMYLEMAKKNRRNRESYIDTSHGYIVDVIEKIRKLSKNLIVPDMQIFGLFDNIRNLLSDLEIVKSTQINFHVNNVLEADIDEKMQLNIFRIIQVQVNNILKHAAASEADISLSKKGEELVLLISDNGQGFNQEEKISGVGILNIISRAELYHGNVTIQSSPGKGYKLKVILPLHKEKMY